MSSPRPILRAVLVVLPLAAALAAPPARAQLAGKKVVLVNSYHEGYAWSDGEEKGAKAVLEPAGVKFQVVRMDVKRHQGDAAFAKAAALKVKADIDAAREHLHTAGYGDTAIGIVGFCAGGGNVTNIQHRSHVVCLFAQFHYLL